MSFYVIWTSAVSTNLLVRAAVNIYPNTASYTIMKMLAGGRFEIGTSSQQRSIIEMSMAVLILAIRLWLQSIDAVRWKIL